MSDEQGFLKAINRDPKELTHRLVYADWLDERDDPRGDFIRLHLALKATAPDHCDRVAGEHELSQLRKVCEPAWLAVIEREYALPRAAHSQHGCGCFEGLSGKKNSPTPYFHVEAQDTECDAWKRLLDLVEDAAADGREEFAPLREMDRATRLQIRTLPPTIAKLKAVKQLHLYGSNLVRIPPEIGEMTSLEEFTPYTSYELHWFPYEITRCPNLKDSTVSTRALYGNYKYRPPFPRLKTGAEVTPGLLETERLPLKRWQGNSSRPCSVCGQPFEDRRQHRVWVSLRVATDVLPLLVNACSEDCIKRLPAPSSKYVQTPHKGRHGVQQPPRGF
ncbi:MAG: hypothetical protein C0467_16045 [Planctomycetaceae bacterium]|nr:hypothetical protein [Planctomycetaceae bacterium]